MEITIRDIKAMNDAGFAIAIHGAHYYTGGVHLSMDNMGFPWGWYLDGKEWDALATADRYDANSEGLVFLADSLDSCYVDIHNIHICEDTIVCDNVNIVLDTSYIEYDPTEDGYYVEKSYGDGYYVRCWRSNWNRWEETYEDAVATCDEENEAYYAEV